MVRDWLQIECENCQCRQRNFGASVRDGYFQDISKIFPRNRFGIDEVHELYDAPRANSMGNSMT